MRFVGGQSKMPMSMNGVTDPKCWCRLNSATAALELNYQPAKYESLWYYCHIPLRLEHCALQFPILFIVAYNSRMIRHCKTTRTHTCSANNEPYEWTTRVKKMPYETDENQSPLKAYRYTQRESYYCRLFVIENYLLGASISLISYGARIHFMTMLIVKKTRHNNETDDDDIAATTTSRTLMHQNVLQEWNGITRMSCENRKWSVCFLSRFGGST